MSTLEERVSRLEGAYEQVDRRLGDLNESINELRAQLRATDAKIDSKINALIIVMVTGGVALTGAILTLAFRI